MATAAIAELSAEIVELLVGGGLCKALVEMKPLVDIGEIAVGDEGDHGKLNIGVDLLLVGLSFELPDRFLHELGVEVESHCLDVARLIFA